jgi:hypothetical protein
MTVLTLGATSVKRVLLIAYHYPPVKASSGLQRTLKFSQYLQEYGWTPLVLTAHPRAYEQLSRDQLEEIPRDIVLERAFALDTGRQLAIQGHYPGWLALPDRWVSWWLGGVWSGLRMVRRYRPRVLWSTYPIATAHLIGLTLNRLTGIPWIADFRDSMTEDNYPPGQARWTLYRWIERRTAEMCRRATFTTPGAVRMYTERYPQIPVSRWVMITNGYDEENFVQAEIPKAAGVSAQGPVVLVHSGLLYPEERNPRPFFQALSELMADGRIGPRRLKIILRASGYEDDYGRILEECGITEMVSLEPAIGYKAALREMLQADGLLVFQAASCNHQIPAKIYEYLRARRPIFALTDPSGDTAGVLHRAGIHTIAPLDDKNKISEGLLGFLDLVTAGHAPIAVDADFTHYSRYALTAQLAALLDAVADEKVS